MSTTQIVFVGHHKDRLIDSIRALREYPISKIILMIGEEELPGEAKVRRIAEEMEQELRTFWDVEIARINKRDVIKAANQLVRLIKEEGDEVILNSSGSLRTLSIAAYIAACITRSRILTSIPKYDEEENEIGVDEIIEIPILPVDFPKREQLNVLSTIGDRVDSLDELIFKLNPDIDKESVDFHRERSRLSHLLAKLEDAGFVRRRKEGRNVRIELSPLGRMVSFVDGVS